MSKGKIIVSEEQTARDTELLGRLEVLVKHARPDFRGNLNPVPKNKTKSYVENQHKREEKLLQGPTTFLPFTHTQEPVGLVATTSSKVTEHRRQHLVADGERAQLPEDHHNKNPFKQKLDPKTKRPELEKVFQWTGDELPTNEADVRKGGRKAFPEKSYVATGLVQPNPVRTVRLRAVRQDVEDLTPRHRTALIRSITLANPKFTAESRVAHSNVLWDPMTQLLAHAYVDPPKKRKVAPPPPQRPNNIRMVEVMRRAKSAGPHPWK